MNFDEKNSHPRLFHASLDEGGMRSGETVIYPSRKGKSKFRQQAEVKEKG
jgi:hypothetical protein